jgi:hypothetical protein
MGCPLELVIYSKKGFVNLISLEMFYLLKLLCVKEMLR